MLIDDPILAVAASAAKIGGEICRNYFSKDLQLDNKAVSNLVTVADVESEQAIVEEIRRHFPKHSILAEENHIAGLDAEHLWVVDPLDGTNNFAHQIPHFAVSIAYWNFGIPQCGVIYNPVREEFYYCQKGQGAYFGESKLQVCSSKQLNQVLVGCGFYYDRGEMMRATLRAVEACFAAHIHGIRRFGTASLDLIQVASGRYGGFFEYQLAPWDFAAGRLFVEEAGGTVTTCRGKELSLDGGTVLATNGNIHAELLEIVTKHHP